ncbi:hypothetical protein [Streptomyces sp. NPDC090131]|uniref:hypothetical protein n=1 Tax=Streptomyces sp. NPDC090131 TaxID=3365954 RepID=UPI00380CFF79
MAGMDHPGSLALIMAAAVGASGPVVTMSLLLLLLLLSGRAPAGSAAVPVVVPVAGPRTGPGGWRGAAGRVGRVGQWAGVVVIIGSR